MEQRWERSRVNLLRFIERPRGLIERSQHALVHRFQSRIGTLIQQVDSLSRLLSGLDPTATLKRGYAIVRHQGSVLRNPAAVKAGDGVVIQLAKGKLGATIDESR